MKTFNTKNLVLFFFLMISIQVLHAQSKSFSQQLLEEEEKERKSNTYQGSATDAAIALEKARDAAKANTGNCASGGSSRKSEDIREYVERNEVLQKKFAESIEKYTTRVLTKNNAISDFNRLIAEQNDLTKWSWGKVTNGTCGPTGITQLIGKTGAVTDELAKQYRTAIESGS